MIAFLFSLLYEIAGHPVLVHFLHPIHKSSTIVHLSLNGLLNSSISCGENFLRAHGHLVIITYDSLLLKEKYIENFYKS